MSMETFVVGHRNPDTDSICSALAYAYLKSKLTKSTYIPKRSGDINPETKFVLNYFNMKEPELINDVKTQVKDIEIKTLAPADPSISLKKAWELMRDNGIATLPVSFDGNKLGGIITVGDITSSYMDMYDSRELTKANTPYRNILEVIEGSMIVGDENANVQNGNILIGAMNPDVMENYITPGDVVILGNRYESQLCAIEMGAQCIIVTGGLPVSMSIKKLAELNKCTIISSPFDTYAATKLINQSIPIGYLMKSDDLAVFSMDDTIDEIRDVMIKKRYRNFPVIDSNNNVIGVISRSSLINMKRKRVILVDHNERTQSVEGLDEAEVIEIIDHHRIGDIQTVSPVYFRNQPLGSTATIVTTIFLENKADIPSNIAGILCAAVLSDTLMFKSPTCTNYDIDIAKQLADIAGLDIYDFSSKMFKAGSSLKNKTEREIFYQDFKQFNIGDLILGIGQINSMDADELDELKIRIIPFMNSIYNEKHFDMILFMLTNIADESTELLFVGNCREVVSNAFNVEMGDNSIRLPGVVSRKKQVVPPLLNAINKN